MIFQKELYDEEFFAGSFFFFLEIRCPIWYSRLNEDLKTRIKNLIGDASSGTRELENLLMDEYGTNRKDVQDLLRWWFEVRAVE